MNPHNRRGPVRNPKHRNHSIETALAVWKDAAAIPRPTFFELAAKYKLSHQRIYQLLQQAVQHFKDDFAAYCEREKFRQVEQLERLSETSWAAWLRSQEPLEEEFRSINRVPGQEGTITQDHQSKRRIRQNGDPRFLDIYLRAKADIRRLLGLDMPILVKVEDTSKISGMLARRYEDAQRKLNAPQEQQKPVDPSGNGDHSNGDQRVN